MRLFDHTDRPSFFILAVLALLCAVGCDDNPFPEDGVYGNPEAIKSQIDFVEVSAYVASTPATAEESPEQLAAYLSTSSTSEASRAYAVYRWIRDNVESDYEQASQQTIDPTTQSPTEVLRTRRAVCTGFARLFEQLTAIAGLNSVRIFGHGVMICRDMTASADGYKHVWNAVEIDGEWYLVDPSWDASPVLDGSDDPDFFFLTQPSEFVHRHLPHDSDWQLLDAPITSGAFWGGLQSCNQ